MIKSDVELGGTDQKFNLLVGRDIQVAYGLEPQVIITCELLEGIDGVEKMSKSMNNSINFTDTPKEIFGKTMSIPDSLIYKYFKLCTPLSNEELNSIKIKLEDKNTNPRDLKVKLGYELVKKYYDESNAQNAKGEFEKIFVKKEIPEDLTIYLRDDPNLKLPNILKDNGLTKSTSDAYRKIQEGAVSIDGEKIIDTQYDLKNITKNEFIIKVGSRKFLKVKKNF